MMLGAAAHGGQLCFACHGTELSFENGVLVCDTCGTQQQMLQEETEFQEGIDDQVRFKRRAAGSTAAPAVTRAAEDRAREQSADAQLADAALVYVRCLQRLVQAQAVSLCDAYGTSPQVASVLRQLWLAHLARTGMCERRPRRPARAPSPSPTPEPGVAADEPGAGEDGMELDEPEPDQEQQEAAAAALEATGSDAELAAGGDADDHAPVTELVKPQRMKRLFWRLLHPQTTLQLCCIACVLLREAITCFDVLRWALDGQLPFLELPHLASSAFSESDLACLPVRCLQAQISLGPSEFCSACSSLARELGLQLPPVPAEALLLRSVSELALPQAVYDVALQLALLHLVGSPRLQLRRLTRGAAAHPYAWLAAALLVAVKLLYGLGGTAGLLGLVPKAPPPPDGWHAWAQAVLQRLPGITSLPLSEEEVLDLDAASVQDYVTFCRQHAFAGQAPVRDCAEYARLLGGWYEESQRQRQQQQQQQRQRQQQQRDAPAAAAAAAAADAEAGGAGAAGPQRDAHGGQQLAGRGAGVPAAEALDAVGRDNYALSMTAPSGAPGSFRLQPELAAVALVLAGHCHASPSLLLVCVRQLEERMVDVEAGLRAAQQQVQKQAAAAAAAQQPGDSADGAG